MSNGYAIMLRVELSQELTDAVNTFVALHSDRSIVGRFPHVTIAFVGRNLSYEEANLVREAAQRFWSSSPREVYLGRFDLFGMNHDHLVCHVDKTGMLMQLRDEITRVITRGPDQLSMFSSPKGLKIQPTSSWRPHVTLCTVEHSRPIEWRKGAGGRAYILDAVTRSPVVAVRSLVSKCGDEYIEHPIAPRKVLFVGVRSIHRAPAAQSIARTLRKDLDVLAVGTSTTSGRVVSKATREALTARGYETTMRSALVDDEALEWADAVYYMDQTAHKHLMTGHSRHWSKFRPLASLVGENRILDPGQGNDALMVVDTLEKAIRRI